MSLVDLITTGKNPTQWDDLILVGAGAIIAIQSVALSQFRQSSFASDKYIPKWYQRLFSFLVGMSLMGWGIFQFWSRGR